MALAIGGFEGADLFKECRVVPIIVGDAVTLNMLTQAWGQRKVCQQASLIDTPEAREDAHPRSRLDAHVTQSGLTGFGAFENLCAEHGSGLESAVMCLVLRSCRIRWRRDQQNLPFVMP